MKRVFSFSLLAVLMCVVAVSSGAQTSNSQSLGDYARAARKTKPAVKPVSKVYDNDNIPHNTTLSVVGNESESAADSEKKNDQWPAEGDSAESQKQASENEQPAQASEEKKAADEKKAAEEKKKASEAWKKKLDAQKQKIDLLSRELNVMQREYQVRAAAFYADAGNRLRNSGQWDTEDRKYKQDIADKQKAVDEARAQLSDMQEQARKAGLPSSAIE